MRIGIVAWMLTKNKGGIERVGVELAGEMRRRGHEVVVFHKEHAQGAAPMYPLDEGVALKGLSIRSTPQGKTEIRDKLAATRPDVLVAMFSWKELLWFPASMIGLGIPLVVSEHSHPEFINWIRWDRQEREAAMSGADRIHVLSERFVPMFPPELRGRITVIPNAVRRRAEPVEREGEGQGQRILMAAGRLEDEMKQFSLLIDAFARIHHRHPRWRLHLFGSGKDRKAYEERIAAAGMQRRILLKGNTEDIASEYARSHLFCTPSLYEGFSMVTAEAHAHGLPVVGFAECTGVNEVIVDGVNGLLAPSMTVDCLARSLEALMQDDALRRTLGRNAMETSRRHAPERVYDAWEALLTEAASLGGRTVLSNPDFAKSGDDLYNLGMIARRRHIFKSCDKHALRATPYRAKPEASLYFVMDALKRELARAKAAAGRPDIMEAFLRRFRRAASCA